MTALVVGAGGMLGHQLVAAFKAGGPVLAAVRNPDPDLAVLCLAVDLREAAPLFDRIEQSRPRLVLNAAGVIKQRPADAAQMWELNARFPHQLAAVCGRAGARLIHLSTDCVFSGDKGGYREDDTPDPVDDYGRSKLEGEPAGPHVMVIRTSMIGLERANHLGLVEWFLRQRGQIEGFTQAIFSGLTTAALSRLIRDHCADRGFRAGLWHVGAAPISKFDLLRRLGAALGRPAADVLASARVRCDRSLDFSRYAAETGYRPPSWAVMIDELVAEIDRRRVVT